MKKILIIPLLACGLISVSSISAFATEQPVSFTVSANSYVDGSNFNRYYHLHKGNVRFIVTEFSGKPSVADVILRRERLGPDKNIEEIRIKGPGIYKFRGADQDSYNYYLYAMVWGPNSVTLKGYLEN
ncbi:hypothetical protein [Clostridium botulinum]|nr:hypothetical protein [Clostridium botulinum]